MQRLLLPNNPLLKRSGRVICNRAAPLRRTFTTNNESFLNGTSGDYVEQQYLAWKKDPSSVHVSWAAFFKNVDSGKPPGSAFVPPPTLFPSNVQQQQVSTQSTAVDNVKVIDLINSFRSKGHKQANLDPLGRTETPYVEAAFFQECG
eukprot:TRINITY_DN315_c0_g3_i2.p1 TRINITY_DN315_c0_g3~~TRINITY_DN315_c0_g3_i2.p1  ORF type:complete len:147 (+),score=27.58 TRINITY_DN315_c0_g3_i2:88-528(+)